MTQTCRCAPGDLAMRRMRPLALVLLCLLARPVPAWAGDLTTRDIVELHHAGLGEEVLLALIDVDGGPFDLSPSAVLDLKAEGLPERVIAALIRAGRRLRVGTNVWAPRETVVEVREVETLVPVAVPVYVPVQRHRGDGGGQAVHLGYDRAYDPNVAEPPLPESSLGPRSRSGPAGAARARPAGRQTTVDAIRHAPAGFHPGNLGPRQGTGDSGAAAAASAGDRRGGTDALAAASTAPTPGIARSTAGQAPPPGVARSISASSSSRGGSSSDDAPTGTGVTRRR